jgi:hypothetical protein
VQEAGFDAGAVEIRQTQYAKGSELKEVLEACPELTRDERIELLTNRCFIRCVKPHDDLLPYDDRFQKVVI